MREPESKETWRAIDDAATEAFKNSPYGQLPFGGGEIIRSSTKIIKVGSPCTMQWSGNKLFGSMVSMTVQSWIAGTRAVCS